MTRPTVGWYVHNHGRGHVTRFLAIRRQLDADVVVFSSLDEPHDLPDRTRWIRLDRDDLAETDSTGRVREPADAAPTAAGLLHWAPLGHRGHRSRLGRIAVETLRLHLAAFVVDVSVEVTLFVRLLGIPVVLVAQPGRRDDDAHRLAYRAATRILAPWPAGLVDEPRFEPGVDVVYTGGISRFSDRATDVAAERSGVLVLLGAGGHAVSDADLDAFSDVLPEEATTILAAGRGWSDDPWPLLASAEIVVSWAGQNSVADIAAAGARAVVIPQQRPFDEQVVTATVLERHDLAVVEPAWPDAWSWPSVLDRARLREPRWSLWQTSGAPCRAAATIAEVAERWLP
ncbi:glycosyltransferase [Frondihabitans australicus]|uniref:Glycosyl transferase family 28 n=1 Tax=Frondihabitans australicus TaxID=386892 RepID=A0A495IFP3_9MICO|nr:glycosyltransferase [Frondihabitans australicus]RKR74817.1 glycosyl transferase family 28 [Frondihabitans australicus]